MTIAAGRALHPGAIYIHGAAAVESIAMDGQSIASEVAAAVTHNSDTDTRRGLWLEKR